MVEIAIKLAHTFDFNQSKKIPEIISKSISLYQVSLKQGRARCCHFSFFQSYLK